MGSSTDTDSKRDSWPTLLRVWFWIQLLVVSFDASFVLTRPHSLPGGAIAFMYPVFHIYAQVDKVYGDPTNPFGWAISTVCLIENAIVAYALFVLHPKEQTKLSKHTVMQWSDYIALMAVTMQFGKSIFYWLNDAYGGFGHIKHNTMIDLIQYFIIPNVIWLIAPLFIFKFFAKKINSTMVFAERTKQN